MKRMLGKTPLMEKAARMRAMGTLAPRFHIGTGLFRVRAGEAYFRLPFNRSWLAISLSGVFLAIFCLPYFSIFQGSDEVAGGSLFDLVWLLFNAFWLIGWSVGTAILLLIFLALSLGCETLHVRPGFVTLRTGIPGIYFGVEMVSQGIQHPRREEPEAKSGLTWRGAHLVFDYGGEPVAFGSGVSVQQAHQIATAINTIAVREAPSVAPATGRKHEAPVLPVTARTQASRKTAARPRRSTPPSLRSLSTLALLVANLVPLLGVLFAGWQILEIMLLYWAESAVIGFYNVLKIAVVGRWSALFYGPFFVGHFGAFMVAHLLFIYGFFSAGADGVGVTTANVAADFLRLWPALAALLVSHGISFWSNFLGRSEYLGKQPDKQMSEPYRRIVLMHVTIIVGGFLAMVFGSPLPALILLILLKVGADVRAHLREHSVTSTIPEIDTA